MNKTLLLCCSLTLFTCAVPTATYAEAPTIEVREHKRIAQIEISVENLPPNFSFDPKTVQSRLKTQVGDPFSQLTFDSDLKTLAEEYDRVEPSVEVLNGEVYVQLKLWPRPKIRTIQWHGNEHVKTKTLQKELSIKPHSTFNRQTFNKAFNNVKEYYVKRGYFESELQYTLITDPKTNEVDIEITVREGRAGKIDDIVFEGFTKEERSQILEMIYTKKYNLFTSWMTGMGIYNEEALEQDRLVITNFLQNEGYADARVAIQVKEAKTSGRIILELIADKGTVYHFDKVSFSGNTLFSNAEIEQRFLVRPEDVYSPEKLRETAEAIKEMYGRKGYIEANVQYDTKLVENEPLYNVHFQIDEGEQYKIGLIRVFGNVQTQTRVILHESLLIPGETFDSAKLKATQARLENIGYFKHVNVYAVKTQEDESLGENYRDVYIEVEETTTGNISLFFGFSSADSVFGGLDLSENNFNYRGITKLFSKGISAIRGGGEYAHIRASIGKKQTSYSLSWMTPYFRDTLWRVGFDLNKTNSTLQSKDYSLDTIGGTVFASYPVAPYWAFGTKYRLKYAHNHVNTKTSARERKEVDNDGVISAISASFSYDSTDSALKPHRGFRSMIEGEFAGLGGKFTFLRLGYLNTLYSPIWRKGTMKYRADFKFIEPIWKTNTPPEIPLTERFFLGGETSVRGYVPFSLGPKFSGTNDPEGGISSSLLSVEYLQEVFRLMDLFFFIDAGAVSLDRFNWGTYRASYGFGTRLEVINRVPVILGMGFPVNPDHEDDVQRFFFSMGGQF